MTITNQGSWIYFIRILFLLICVILYKLEGHSPNLTLSGHVDYSYISRLSDRSLINIPYRMVSLDIERQADQITLNGSFALEYHVRDDSYFLGSSDPQDFIFDMRELYVSYNTNKYEFRVGKQIHSWGSVDENSPLDNASSLDYYYMFFG